MLYEHLNRPFTKYKREVYVRYTAHIFPPPPPTPPPLAYRHPLRRLGRPPPRCHRSREGRHSNRHGHDRNSSARRSADDGDDLEESGPATLSPGEMQDRRGNAAAARAAAAAAGTLSAAPRPRTQGDDVPSRESRKRPLPGSRAELRSEGGSRQQQQQRQHQGLEAGGVRGGGDGRAAVTWRGRLQGEDRGKEGGYEKGPGLLSSGKKFEDLDNYLRGCAAVAGAKQEKRKRGRRLGGSSLSGGSGGGGGNSVETGGSSLSLAEEYEV